MKTDFILFDISAIESLIRLQEFQSYDFTFTQQLIKSICEGLPFSTGDINSILKDKGLLFIGSKTSDEKQFIVFDSTQCDLFTSEKSSPENLLIVLLKTFRAAIRFWRNQPFTSAERVNHTKLIIFPFKYNMNGKQNKRLVLERQPGIKKFFDFGIKRPLLAYKYNDEDVIDGANEIASVDVLIKASECYLSTLELLQNKHQESITEKTEQNGGSLASFTTEVQVCRHDGFKYMEFDRKKENLTNYQKEIIFNPDIKIPIRVDGPAGTGKTMSLILRAYHLLCFAQQTDREFRVIFFAHSESTRYEIEETFKLNNNAEDFLYNEGNTNNKQTIEIVTLLDWCMNFVGFQETDLTDQDAYTAKEYQRLMIHESFEKCYRKSYNTYAPHLSKELKELIEPNIETSFYSLDFMLQHEFSVQIKGRANGDLEKYKDLKPILNGLPAKTHKDKEFIYSIFKDYQNELDIANQYDSDDVVIETISRLNAPRWRRERSRLGYDYIFVDEMHLFNSNEQYTFHYLTQDINQTKVPICFALDYSQAFGDRGDVFNDYIETEISCDAFKKTYQTVFRSSQAITDFCASIIASGINFFESSFNNPYSKSESGLNDKEKTFCEKPQLFMYQNDDLMLGSIKRHVSSFKKDLGAECNNYEIAVISFVDNILDESEAKRLIGRNCFILKSRNASGLNSEVKRKDQLILSSPYNVNGLEFKCVILVGVDEGRVPQTNGTADISSNYLRYSALNQLYLCSSRAKYRLIILGNSLHGVSSCLQYPIEAENIDVVNISE